jgi:hypothetical protein
MTVLHFEVYFRLAFRENLRERGDRIMIRNYIALITIIALVGMCSPVLAGDLVSPNLLPASSVAVRQNIPATIAAFSMPEGAGQTPAAAPKPASSGGKQRTTKGKVLIGVGAGLAGVGAALLISGATLKDPCAGISGPYITCTSNYTSVRGARIGVGAGSAVAGVILLIKGLGDKQ